MSWNDTIQYVLIIALALSLLFHRGAHVGYAKVLNAMYADLHAAIARIEAKIESKDKPQ